ncbi:MAG TPA: hypothetical protein DEP18_07585 [Flavobacteriales bacterium]|nr:hypothetical protein [Flavobacteriales bacterium]HCA83633.1 hypothetical protein [Flavobacteriales bacterium]HRE74438.1 hypothetical protein [Flavobacteriales bacterium]HRJ35646.1 hypothetical protein [Flavobacteriales bacterium]HRJ38923.1 hypothetical protein [Flavobacteriales bacterium]
MKHILVNILLICVPLFGFSQEVKLQLNLGEIRIGEPCKLNIEVRLPNEKSIIGWPEFTDTFSTSKLEIISKSAPAMVNQLTGQMEYTVTSFDSGYHAIPPVSVLIDGDSILSNALLIKVNTVEVDTTKQFRDIKNIEEEPFSWKDYFLSIWYWILDNWYIVLSIVILTIALVLYIIRKRKKNELPPPPPLVAPHIEAIERLRIIEKEQQWQKGFYKDYYTSLSDCLRHYIERRFNVAALEQTTDEVVRSLRLIDLDEESRRHLVYVLKLSDLAKFAKEQPAPHENESALKRSFEFVQRTQSVEPEIPSKENE